MVATWMLMPWSGESQRWLGGLFGCRRYLFRQGLSNWQVTSDRKKWDLSWNWDGISGDFFCKKQSESIHLSCVVWSLINFLCTFTQQRLDITRWASSQSYLSKCAMISLRCARDSWLFARHSATYSGAARHRANDAGITKFAKVLRWPNDGNVW